MKTLLWVAGTLMGAGAAGVPFLQGEDEAPAKSPDCGDCCGDPCVVRVECENGTECELTIECQGDECVVVNCDRVGEECSTQDCTKSEDCCDMPCTVIAHCENGMTCEMTLDERGGKCVVVSCDPIDAPEAPAKASCCATEAPAKTSCCSTECPPTAPDSDPQ